MPNNLVQAHIAGLLFSFSALVVYFLSSPVLLITFGRALFSAICIIIVILYLGKNIALHKPKDYFFLLIAGII